MSFKPLVSIRDREVSDKIGGIFVQNVNNYFNICLYNYDDAIKYAIDNIDVIKNDRIKVDLFNNYRFYNKHNFTRNFFKKNVKYINFILFSKYNSKNHEYLDLYYNKLDVNDLLDVLINGGDNYIRKYIPNIINNVEEYIKKNVHNVKGRYFFSYPFNEDQFLEILLKNENAEFILEKRPFLLYNLSPDDLSKFLYSTKYGVLIVESQCYNVNQVDVYLEYISRNKFLSSFVTNCNLVINNNLFTPNFIEKYDNLFYLNTNSNGSIDKYREEFMKNNFIYYDEVILSNLDRNHISTTVDKILSDNPECVVFQHSLALFEKYRKFIDFNSLEYYYSDEIILYLLDNYLDAIDLDKMNPELYGKEISVKIYLARSLLAV